MKALYFSPVYYPYVHMTDVCNNVVALDSRKYSGQYIRQTFGTHQNTVTCVNKILFISVFNQLDAQNLFHNKFYFMPLLVSSTCAHHQEVKIVLHSLW